MKTKLFLLIISFVFLCLNSNAQIIDEKLDIGDNSQVHQIVLNNGSTYIGRITSMDNSMIKLSVQNDTSLIDLRKVNLIAVVQDQPVAYTLPAHNSNHLFVSPTAYTLPRGFSEYRTVYGILHTWDKAVSRNVQFGIGASFPLFLMFRSKIGWKVGRKTNMALGFNYAFVPLSLGNEWLASSHYFLGITSGSPNNHFNLGFNLFRFSDDLADNEDNEDGFIFSLTFGGRIRLGNNWQLLAENTISTVTDNFDVVLLPSFGACWFNHKNSVEFGFKRSTIFNEALIPILGTTSLAQLPFLSYSRRIYN